MILAAATVYGFIWLFEHMSMNVDGSLTVNLPWTTRPPILSEGPSEPLELVITSPETAPSPTGEINSPQPRSSAAPPPAPPDLSAPRAVFVTQDKLDSADALADWKANAEAAGMDVFVLDYKSDEGDVITQEKWERAVDALGPEFRYIARISAFMDNAKPRQNNSIAIRNARGNLNWFDGQSRWLNPYAEGARDYLLTVIDDAAALGADGILIDHLCFPWDGPLEEISYGTSRNTPRAEAMQAFCTGLDGLGLLIPVWVVALNETALTGLQETAGQDLEMLRAHFSAIFLEWPDELDMLPDETVIPILSEPWNEALSQRLEGWTQGFLLTGAVADDG